MSLAPYTGDRRQAVELTACIREKIVVCPGVYDGITARLSRATGFEALYMVSV